VMFGKAHRIVAEVVGKFDEFGVSHRCVAHLTDSSAVIAPVAASGAFVTPFPHLRTI
jgi:hypothetical protein